MKTKNLLKGLISLSLLTIMCACDNTVKALPSDQDDKIGNTKMATIYNELYNELGSSAAFDKVLLNIAKIEVKSSRYESLYERINDKMQDLIDSTTYTDYTDYTLDEDGEVVGDFDEEKLINYLRSQGYKISKGTSDEYSIWDAEDAINNNGGVVNTYITDYYYPTVIKEMLNEEYIVSEQSSKIKNGRYRNVEFVYVDFDSENPERTLDSVYDFEDKIKSEATYVDGVTSSTLMKEFADEWKTYQKDQLDYKAANINNPDVDKDLTYASKFTCSFTKDVETCLKSLKLSIDQTEYYTETDFYSNYESSILTSSMRDLIFSSKVLDKNSNDEYKYVYEAPDGSLYLKQSLGSDSIVNIDSSTNKYYFVRINVVDGDKLNASKDAYDLDLAYQAAEILRTNTSTTTASIVHYLEKYEVEFHDEDLYEYVLETYNYPDEED